MNMSDLQMKNHQIILAENLPCEQDFKLTKHLFIPLFIAAI